jgi:hypothetical protein
METVGSGQEVYEVYTDCSVLKNIGFRQVRQPANRVGPSGAQVNNNTVNLRRACSAKPNDPMCLAGKAPASTTDQVKVVHQMVIDAQYRGTRSLEKALQQRSDANDRYVRAQCNRIMESLQVVGPPAPKK